MKSWQYLQKNGVKGLVPGLKRALRKMVGPPPPQFVLNNNTYENLYEYLAQATSSKESIGGGEFNEIGQFELNALLKEGLQPGHTLLDFGCGIGRLAAYAVPFLKGGSFIGIDISDTMLAGAKKRIEEAVPNLQCQVTWIKMTNLPFPLHDQSVDMICAFSVFTHMEHEDTYRYLKDALRIIRPGCRFLFTCLPLKMAWARQVFLRQAALDFQNRWSFVRDVATSVDLMTEIARLAGWQSIRWYGDDVNNDDESGKVIDQNQAFCVLERSA